MKFKEFVWNITSIKVIPNNLYSWNIVKDQFYFSVTIENTIRKDTGWPQDVSEQSKEVNDIPIDASMMKQMFREFVPAARLKFTDKTKIG